MILIGMLHHRKDPKTVQKSYAYAAVAVAEGAELLYFSPGAVNLSEKKISGYIYKNGIWQKVDSFFPDVIYNTGSPEKLAKSSEIIDALRKEIPFTTNSIGNKMRVQRRLEKYEEFTKYLIPSEYIHSTKAFFRILRIYGKIIFKPVNGHKGQGINFIETVSEEYHVLIGSEKLIFNFEQMRDYVLERIREDIYLAQPYINCKTKDGITYDLRLHVQKKWRG